MCSLIQGKDYHHYLSYGQDCLCQIAQLLLLFQVYNEINSLLKQEISMSLRKPFSLHISAFSEGIRLIILEVINPIYGNQVFKALHVKLPHD